MYFKLTLISIKALPTNWISSDFFQRSRQDMDNAQKVRYFYEHITSNNLLDEVSDYIADNCIVKMGDQVIPVGIEGMKQHMIEVRKTYPDLKMTIIRQYTDGDTVISEFIMEGTHLGEWLGMKPTGKKLRMTGVDIDKLIDGKIVEHGGAVNTFEALFEEGIIKPA
jgi:predicted ester cyclase